MTGSSGKQAAAPMAAAVVPDVGTVAQPAHGEDPAPAAAVADALEAIASGRLWPVRGQ